MRPSQAQPKPAPPPPPPPPRSEKRLFNVPRSQLLKGAALVLAIAVLYLVKNRSAKPGPSAPPESVAVATPTSAPPPDTTPDSAPAVVDPPVEGDRGDPAIGELALQGVPGEIPEADLETRLRLADALMWNVAEDFADANSVVRSRRKVDAVLNSIQAYRYDMRRLSDSAGTSRFGNRIEPFDESSRIDDVIRAMGEAVAMLEEVSGRYVVRGGVLVFDRGEDARRYNLLRSRADSLLRAPVEFDAHPVLRPPRRFVTRLLATLPAGQSSGP